MKTLKIIIKGIVQKVGYRSFVDRIAKRLKLKGYVKNLDDPEESVEIVVQDTDKKVIEDFLQRINIKTELTDVQQIIRQETDEREFVKFEIVRGPYEEENAERLDIAAYHLDSLTKEVHGLTREVKTGFGEMGDKLETVGNKLDTVGNKLDTFHQDTVNRFDVLDHKYGKISATLERISIALEKLAGINKK